MKILNACNLEMDSVWPLGFYSRNTEYSVCTGLGGNLTEIFGSPGCENTVHVHLFCQWYKCEFVFVLVQRTSKHLGHKFLDKP